jgi:3-oxoacyl-[acyl-carrier protein] reductase
MDLGVRGRVAVVCAASQGLGKAAAFGFAREGANVVMCSRDKKRLQQAAQDIRSGISDGDVTVLPVVADVTRPRQINSLIERTVKEFGRLDILVTNAGGPPVASFADLTDDRWKEGVDLTLLSVIRMIRAAVPHMRSRQWGRIVNITSVVARQPIPDLVISSTLRPGVLGLAKALATEYAQDGILINSVAPGYFLTARQKELTTARAAQRGIPVEQYLLQMAADVPLKRYGDPDELAHMIVFLGSERASYITGATISVDGGMARGLL